jgi:hypothetical protein
MRRRKLLATFRNVTYLLHFATFQERERERERDLRASILEKEIACFMNEQEGCNNGRERDRELTRVIMYKKKKVALTFRNVTCLLSFHNILGEQRER